MSFVRFSFQNFRIQELIRLLQSFSHEVFFYQKENKQNLVERLIGIFSISMFSIFIGKFYRNQAYRNRHTKKETDRQTDRQTDRHRFVVCLEIKLVSVFTLQSFPRGNFIFNNLFFVNLILKLQVAFLVGKCMANLVMKRIKMLSVFSVCLCLFLSFFLQIIF